MALRLSGERSLVFIGFMGAGKTAAARAAARALAVPALDSDERIVERLGMPIAEVFANRGEEEFRREEEETVLELLGARPPVLALGGGAVLSARVREKLREHTVVLLDVDAETAWSRARGERRPLASDHDHFIALHAERAPIYEAAADVVLLPGELERVRRALPAIRALAAGERMIWAVSSSGEYPVRVRRGLLADPRWPDPDTRRLLVSDEHVAALHALPGAERLALIAPGEASKTLAQAEAIWHLLVDAGATRADALVALGGGVVGDLTGFCAAAYQRGMPVIQVPTTLLAQVDSAYGGKTGVDLPQAKNYVGAYHQPAAVLVDPAALDTLPAAERAAGYAEVVKTALIAGGWLWERVRGGALQNIGEREILACARAKLAVVAADERDAGRRQVLNLGHTVGHAVESVTGYRRYRHGEAVALGLLATLRLSGLGELRSEVAELLAAAGLPTVLDPSVDVDEVVAATARDKKRTGRAATPFVLLEQPGSPRPGCPVPGDALRAAVEELTR